MDETKYYFSVKKEIINKVKKDVFERSYVDYQHADTIFETEINAEEMIEMMEILWNMSKRRKDKVSL